MVESPAIGGEVARENYESIVMFAFRKLQAARYHRQRKDSQIPA
jgi:hypothetical protein